jgi:hypothetical protein
LHNSYWYVEQLVGYLIPWTNYMHLYCVSYSGLQCNKHNSYWYVEQLVGYLIPWTNYMHLYCVSDSGILEDHVESVEPIKCMLFIMICNKH